MLFSGLPVQVRDHALGLKDDVPKSDVNKEFYTQNVEKEVHLSLFFSRSCCLALAQK